ncbi:hypothetical protein [Pontibacillus salipaludis]|uniref:hypothetical protein n=1 Tax=Pontibacillus salipaludis TaxID=1697394 RepID=UPI0031EDC3C1
MKIAQVLIVVTLLFLVACQSNEVFVKPYEGESLRLAVVGEVPEVREEQVTFTSLSLDEVVELRPHEYNAVLIKEGYLAEAAEQKYVDMYKEKDVPFFFVKSKALAIPFQDIENLVSYEEQATRVDDTGHYISGLYYVGKEQGYKSWEFSYTIEDDEYKRDDVEGVYSQLFQVIEEQSG